VPLMTGAVAIWGALAVLAATGVQLPVEGDPLARSARTLRNAKGAATTSTVKTTVGSFRFAVCSMGRVVRPTSTAAA
jgi:hypothetical protein